MVGLDQRGRRRQGGRDMNSLSPLTVHVQVEVYIEEKGISSAKTENLKAVFRQRPQL
jgi:hypothetical protein